MLTIKFIDTKGINKLQYKQYIIKQEARQMYLEGLWCTMSVVTTNTNDLQAKSKSLVFVSFDTPYIWFPISIPL